MQDEKNIKKAETQQNKMIKILDVRDENNKDRERVSLFDILE